MSAEGPGRRTAIWTQGCSIRCHGCINPHLFPAAGGHDMTVAEIIRGALASQDEGITILGGEPFDQAAACAALSRAAQAGGLGVICFTGHVMEDLVDDPSAQALLQHVDLLVDGPYMADSPDVRRSLVGSTNQRFHHLTTRYAGYEPDQTPDRLEVRIARDGSVEGAGFLTQPQLEGLASDLGLRRVPRRTPQPPNPEQTGAPPSSDDGAPE
ncbi:4Fe-4S single cluster domain-containing protein [Luteococcus sanguinis]|uniref:4Fe-4S single cluster domain-containing protein n=1 Tax=Luteococcus sanguinis TaxID=174038 RepID=A0ABW1WX22_9ACTN